MSEVAAKAIVGAAAPGQFNVVAENLSKLGQPSSNWFAEAQAELDAFQCKGLETNLDHPIAKALHEKMEEYQKENFLSKPGVMLVTPPASHERKYLTVRKPDDEHGESSNHIAHNGMSWI